jgi:hypothetical protein
LTFMASGFTARNMSDSFVVLSMTHHSLLP